MTENKKYPIHIVLDLDETLIHSSEKKHKIENEHFTIGDLNNPYYIVYKRKGLDEFIQWLYDTFELVSVWTAATCDYAVDIITNIKLTNIKYLLVRQHVELTEKKCGPKCLDCFKQFFMSDNIKGVIIIDDNEHVKNANNKDPKIQCLHITPFKPKKIKEDSMMDTIKPQILAMAENIMKLN